MNSEIDYFKIETNHILPGKGKILIAEPFLNDVYFKRSLVLLTEYNKEGAVGFVLNKPVSINIQDIIEDFPEFKAEISIGGPVQTNTLQFIHSLGSAIPGSTHLFGDLYWGGQFEVLKDLISQNLLSYGQVKFFMGYSGWTSGQLEDEIKKNSWLVGSLGEHEIMKTLTPNNWENTLLSMGSRYKMWTNAPSDPTLN
jgi:putative transcriptional regulator